MNDDRELNAALLEVAEREQLLIAEDFHDTLCPSLVGISLLLRLSLRRVENGKPVDSADLRKICDYLDEAIEYSQTPFHIQAISQNESGLGKALQRLARLTAKKTKCQFLAEEEIKVGDARAARVLYRIAQEAVRNAVRAAQATDITLTLRQDPTGLYLEILAEGCETAGTSLKLLKKSTHLRHYADAVGLKLVIESKSKTATCVSCALPRS